MARVASLVGVTLVLAGLTAAGEARAEQRFAVVIGANPGWAQDRPLRYAEQDAERVRDVLLALGGVTPERMVMLRDPDSGEVRAALGRIGQALRAAAGEETLVLVYYSGHADAQHLHVRGEPALSHRELLDLLRGLPATVKLGVVDACRSGAYTQKGGRPTAEFDVDVVSPTLSGTVVLTSSGADELSQESRALAGSVFTHHLVSGMRGAADANGDLVVTLSEAYRHAFELTRADTAVSAAPQRPAFRYELSGQGELALTRLAAQPAQHAQLRLPRGQAERYVVLDEHEWRLIAEARPAPDRAVSVAVAPGSYRVKHVLFDRIEVASLSLAPGAVVDLGSVSYRPAPIASGILKGEPEDLSPSERHEWERTQAFHVLAEGNANAAINMFDRLVYEQPGDTVAWRGRARALVRIAESYRAMGIQAQEQRALIEALKSDPTLTYDPDFHAWYQGNLRAEIATYQAAETRIAERFADPRRGHSYGLGVNLISARGLLSFDAFYATQRRVFVSVGLDLVQVGLDAAIAWVPFRSRWSPYGALGGHVSVAALGVELYDPPDPSMPEDRVPAKELYAVHARGELGLQYVNPSGFLVDLGASLMLFSNKDGKATLAGWPVIHLGWLF